MLDLPEGGDRTGDVCGIEKVCADVRSDILRRTHAVRAKVTGQSIRVSSTREEKALAISPAVWYAGVSTCVNHLGTLVTCNKAEYLQSIAPPAFLHEELRADSAAIIRNAVHNAELRQKARAFLHSPPGLADRVDHPDSTRERSVPDFRKRSHVATGFVTPSGSTNPTPDARTRGPSRAVADSGLQSVSAGRGSEPAIVASLQNGIHSGFTGDASSIDTSSRNVARGSDYTFRREAGEASDSSRQSSPPDILSCDRIPSVPEGNSTATTHISTTVNRSDARRPELSFWGAASGPAEGSSCISQAYPALISGCDVSRPPDADVRSACDAPLPPKPADMPQASPTATSDGKSSLLIAADEEPSRFHTASITSKYSPVLPHPALYSTPSVLCQNESHMSEENEACLTDSVATELAIGRDFSAPPDAYEPTGLEANRAARSPALLDLAEYRPFEPPRSAADIGYDETVPPGPTANAVAVVPYSPSPVTGGSQNRVGYSRSASIASAEAAIESDSEEFPSLKGVKRSRSPALADPSISSLEDGMNPPRQSLKRSRLSPPAAAKTSTEPADEQAADFSLSDSDTSQEPATFAPNDPNSNNPVQEAEEILEAKSTATKSISQKHVTFKDTSAPLPKKASKAKVKKSSSVRKTPTSTRSGGASTSSRMRTRSAGKSDHLDKEVPSSSPARRPARRAPYQPPAHSVSRSGRVVRPPEKLDPVYTPKRRR